MLGFGKRLVFWVIGTPFFLGLGMIVLVLIVFAWGLVSVVLNIDVFQFLKKYLRL